MASGQVELIHSAFRSGAPLLIAVLGGIVSSRAGVFNVALESFISCGALAHSLVWILLKHRFGLTESGALLGAVLAAVAIGAGLGSIFGFLARKGLNQIISGIILNLCLMGLIRTLEKTELNPLTQLYGGGISFDSLRHGGVIHPVWWASVFGLAGAIMLTALFSYTRIGRQSTALGRVGGTAAAGQVGIDIPGVRFACSVWTGMLCSIAGVTLVWVTGGYAPGMAAGRGYIAIALALIGNRSILAATGVALIYGLAQSPQMRAMVNFDIPPQIVDAFPYCLTLVVLTALGVWSRPRRSRLILRDY